MCRFCNDTGSTEKTLWGYFDCGHCDTAEQRMKLDKWITQLYNRGDLQACISSADAWLIFQHGKAAAAAQ